jgi:hypothetical protein
MHLRDPDSVEKVPESSNPLTVSSTEDPIQQALVSLDSPVQKVAHNLSSFEEIHLGCNPLDRIV